MTGFTAGAAHAAIAAFPVRSLADLRIGALVVVAPHPDDESLGCGGLIAACRANDIAVRIVVVSDGSGSHPNSRRWPPPRLARLRREETLAAATCLGVADLDVHFLELPDRAVPAAGAGAERAAAALAALAAGADTMAVTWRHDPHTDHRASCAIARAACVQLPATRLWEYPVWGLTLPPEERLPGPLPTGFRLDIAAHREAKVRAIASHLSQTTALIDDDPGGFRLEPAMIARFCRDHEPYIEAAS